MNFGTSKSTTNYNNNTRSAAIVDYVSGSVVFDTVDDLISGFTKFQNEMNTKDDDHADVERLACVREIVGIHEAKNSYFDILANVLVECNGTKMITQLRFCLSCIYKWCNNMQLARDFLSNEICFNRLRHLSNDKFRNNDKLILKRLYPIILCHNIDKFSAYLESNNLYETYYLFKNETFIANLLKQNEWKLGSQLFEYILKERKNHVG